MVEFIMIFALGALAATLVALACLPALDRRAQRLARRRLEALFPLSIAEIAAERDHVRAAMAVEARRAELKAEAAAKEKATNLAELGRRQIAVQRLTEETAALRAEILRLNGGEAVALAPVGAEPRAEAAPVERAEPVGSDQGEAYASLKEELRRATDAALERQVEIASLELRLEGAFADGRATARRLGEERASRLAQIEAAAAEQNAARMEKADLAGRLQEARAMIALLEERLAAAAPRPSEEARTQPRAAEALMEPESDLAFDGELPERVVRLNRPPRRDREIKHAAE